MVPFISLMCSNFQCGDLYTSWVRCSPRYLNFCSYFEWDWSCKFSVSHGIVCMYKSYWFFFVDFYNLPITKLFATSFPSHLLDSKNSPAVFQVLLLSQHCTWWALCLCPANSSLFFKSWFEHQLLRKPFLIVFCELSLHQMSHVITDLST